MLKVWTTFWTWRLFGVPSASTQRLTAWSWCHTRCSTRLSFSAQRNMFGSLLSNSLLCHCDLYQVCKLVAFWSFTSEEHFWFLELSRSDWPDSVVSEPIYSERTFYIFWYRRKTIVLRYEKRKVRARRSSGPPCDMKQGSVLRNLCRVSGLQESPEFAVIRGVMSDLSGTIQQSVENLVPRKTG